jgi:hypothetical protein
MKTDVAAWEAEQDRKMHVVIDRLQGIPGVSLSVDQDPNGNPFSRARVTILSDEAGLSAAVVCSAMAEGDPSISLRGHHSDEGYFNVDTIEMSDDEVETTCKRLEAILKTAPVEKAALVEKFGGGEVVDSRSVWLG